MEGIEGSTERGKSGRKLKWRLNLSRCVGIPSPIRLSRLFALGCVIQGGYGGLLGIASEQQWIPIKIKGVWTERYEFQHLDPPRWGSKFGEYKWREPFLAT